MDKAGLLSRPMTAEDLEALFKIMLKRKVGNTAFVDSIVASGISIHDYLVGMRHCAEFKQVTRAERDAEDRAKAATEAGSLDANRRYYRIPQDLAITEKPVRRAALIGQCLIMGWEKIVKNFRPNVNLDIYLVGAPLPDEPQKPFSDYDFQVVQLPLRAILPDGTFNKLKQNDLAGHQQLLQFGKSRIDGMLHACMKWNIEKDMLTFLLNFLEPQQNPVGRLLPPYDIRNPVYFIRQLNEHLASKLAEYRNSYFVDMNEILSSFGNRHYGEDPFALMNHGGFANDFDWYYDKGKRLEEVTPLSKTFEIGNASAVEAIWLEIETMLRSIRQIDQVKLVVVDLDDTLWRGTVAEQSASEMLTSEGWPKSLWEALDILKRRGILLAIISKNEEAVVLSSWNEIFGKLLKLEDFVTRKINWAPKSQNMSEILEEVNLTPASVIYIDDNPVQREEILQAFPGIRVLGGTPTLWRRVLLWSAETQLSSISDESLRRTEMIQAQIERDGSRGQMSSEEFLKTLDLKMNFIHIDSKHVRFLRSLELINKTNQFNTTGQRWTNEEVVASVAGGMEIFAFELSDKYTDYGLVGVFLVKNAEIIQFVMSCRVMGLGAEEAAIATIKQHLQRRGQNVLGARIVETERNLPCRNVYERCGFIFTGERWESAEELAVSPHIFVQNDKMALI
jgi:FkbH-like protein